MDLIELFDHEAMIEITTHLIRQGWAFSYHSSTCLDEPVSVLYVTEPRAREYVAGVIRERGLRYRLMGIAK